MTQFGSAPRTTGPLWKKLQGKQSAVVETRRAEQEVARHAQETRASERPASVIAPLKPERRIVSGARPIEGIAFAGLKIGPVSSSPPTMRFVKPGDLLVEPSYQRELSAKSTKLIRKIVACWDWMKFKPPVCAETSDGLFVIDGQHTAIAAASHAGIDKIPVMIVTARLVVNRAEAFVSHNRDRLAMSPFQIFHAEVAAGNSEAARIMRIAEKTGAIIPRSPPLKGRAAAGQIVAITELRRILGGSGPEVLERVLRIAVAAEIAPLGNTAARALRMLLTAEIFSEIQKMPDSRIANALKAIPNIDQAAKRFAIESGQGKDRACAVLIARKTGLAFPTATVARLELARPADETAERLRQLEGVLADDTWVPHEWGLTKHETQLLNALVLRRMATKEAIHTIIYGDDVDGGPDIKIIDVFVCKMRPKLKNAGIEITTVWGNGYQLTEESRATINALKGAQAA